ncbi:MAG: protoporphyrinogen oxidase [Coraliomargaritaceae bacterium]
MSRTCIVGAGISGLASAWQRTRRGEECTVLESASQVGGALCSIRKNGFLAEEGPNSIQVDSPHLENFLRSIPGLDEQIIVAKPEANKRYIIRDGKPIAVPMHPLQAISNPLWSLSAKLRLLREPWIQIADASSDESVADFARRRLGEEFYQYAINPLVGGIYAGNPENLSLRHAFPKLHAMEQEHGSLLRGALARQRAARKEGSSKPRKRIITFREGIDTLPRQIAQALGDRVQTGVSIDSIKQKGDLWQVEWNGQQESFDQVIVTIPAHSLNKLPFEASLHRALAPLQEIEYPPVSVLSLGFKREQVAHPLDGFGVLVPECEDRKILGVLFPSSVFTERAPKDSVLLTVFIGGTRNPEEATEDTDHLTQTVLPEIESLLGTSGQPQFIHHRYWAKAIPQYNTGYRSVFEQIETIEKTYPGLQLLGNYRSGVSLTNCLSVGQGFS